MFSFAKRALTAALATALLARVQAQTFQRLGTCPELGCIFPPDQADFLAGQYFDIRLEIHAPKNGSQAINRSPDEDFTFTIARSGAGAQTVEQFFGVPSAPIETWNFTWFEDLFARDAGTPSLVQVASKAYRRVYLSKPGEYTATLKYYNGESTVATWTVRDIPQRRKAKNAILFIGDGMTTNMITAGRLIAHKTKNGKYQSKMQLDKFPILGHQMTHSIDSFITDSANSATALYTGHKSTVNALGVYADSSPNKFDDPKVETIAELFHRIQKGHVGIVSTAFLADATPAALTAHTRDRNQYGAVIDSFLHGITNYTWTNWTGPDVLFGGGAENFFNSSKGGKSYQDKDYFAEFAKSGYQVAYTADQLDRLSNKEKALGVFTISNMAKWLDRNVYTANLNGHKNYPTGNGADAVDQPGLREMTLKAIDILEERSGDNGWLIMSEAASIDKMMHVLDYDRALGELLELDDTVKATIEKLTELGSLEETLILVTADHGHGFDVAGSVDTKYLQAQTEQRKKRDAIGTYQNSGLSQYALTGNLTYSDGMYFPSNWDPRYTLYQGVVVNPDRTEDWQVNKDGPRVPAVNITAKADYYANPKDGQGGVLVNGTLPVSAEQGVHSLTDVPVFAMGPCQELFGGVYGNIDIFYNMAECLGLSQTGNNGGYGNGPGDSHHQWGGFGGKNPWLNWWKQWLNSHKGHH